MIADAYTRLWDFFWLPIGFISKLLIQSKLLPPHWILTVARWRTFRTLAREINDDHYTIYTHPDCETCRSLTPGELDIDNEREIKHDPFDILSNLKKPPLF